MKKGEVKMPAEEVEVIEEVKPKSKAKGKDKPEEVKAKGKKGGLRAMSDKEKEVFRKWAKGKDKSEKAKARMKVMRSAKPVDTVGKLKKLME